MRTIKFRGKRTDTGEWIYGYYLEYSLCDGKGRCSYIKIDGCQPIKVLPDSIGQFTGLLDKNGKEIYEGDILESRYDDSVSLFGYCLVRNRVSYDQGTFGVIGEVTGDLMPFFDYPLQDEYVIGNIHDNPELLKGGKE